jgi:hypothetical protein
MLASRPRHYTRQDRTLILLVRMLGWPIRAGMDVVVKGTNLLCRELNLCYPACSGVVTQTGLLRLPGVSVYNSNLLKLFQFNSWLTIKMLNDIRPISNDKAEVFWLIFMILRFFMIMIFISLCFLLFFMTPCKLFPKIYRKMVTDLSRPNIIINYYWTGVLVLWY